MANVRKLMRMAREFEADEGRDLRGFIDSVAERDVLQAREGEAPLEAEALDAVRLMTVHRAKGLEFPVVCVADLGKEGRDDDGPLRISDDGTPGPAAGRRSAGHGRLRARSSGSRREGKAAAEEEERRIFYVAATRAQEHLILSGATRPGEAARARRPDGADALGLARLRAGCRRDAATGRARGRARRSCDPRALHRLTPDTLDELLPPADRAPAASRGGGRPRAAELELGVLPAPRALPVSRLSYSGLEAYRRCGYRFYLQRALGLRAASSRRSRRRAAAPRPGSAACCAARSCTGCSSGSTSRARWCPPRREVARRSRRTARTVRRRGGGRSARHGRARRRLAPARAHRARPRRVRTELPFAFTLAPPGAGGAACS